MEKIRKGDRLTISDSAEPMVASRDEYNQRVWVMSAREYELQNSGQIQRGKEQPYLVAPDRTLIRDHQHGFPEPNG